MKKNTLIVILILLISPLYAQDGIRWMSMNEALEAQKETPKKILMDVYTSWCGPCKLLDKNTFGNKDVIKYVNKNYYPVKFNAEGTESVTYQDFTYTNPNYQEGRKGRKEPHTLYIKDFKRKKNDLDDDKNESSETENLFLVSFLLLLFLLLLLLHLLSRKSGSV